MNGFISQLLALHTGAGAQVQPRLTGRFEGGYGATIEPLAQPGDGAPARDEFPAPAGAGTSSGEKPELTPTSTQMAAVRHPAPQQAMQPVLVNAPPLLKVAMTPEKTAAAPVLSVPVPPKTGHPEMTRPKVPDTVKPVSGSGHQPIDAPPKTGPAVFPAVRSEERRPVATSPVVQPSLPVLPPVVAAAAPMSQREAGREAVTPQRPLISVSIGRVEVRAVFPVPAAKTPPPAGARPGMSLEDYQKKRNSQSR